MPYPPRTTIRHDFALDDQQGNPVDGLSLAVELEGVAEALNQILTFIKAGFTADKRWRPAEANGQELKFELRFVATAGQTDFDISTVTFDPVANKAVVFVNGLKVDGDDVAVTATTVTIPAVSASDVVEVHLFNDENDLRAQLASQLADLGASLIGIEDRLGMLSAATVEGALEELAVRLNNLQAGVGDLDGLIRQDGQVPFTQNQSMGLNRLVDVDDGIDQRDAATVGQLNALAAIFGDLSNIFLALTGGVLSGNLSLGNNFLLDVKDGAQATDGINKGQLDAAVAALQAAYLPLAGGTMTGEINSKQNDKAIRIRQAVDADEPVRKDQVDDLVAAAILNGTFGIIGGTGLRAPIPADPACPVPGDYDPDEPGIFDYRDSFEIATLTNITALQLLRCTGVMRLTDTITVANRSTLRTGDLMRLAVADDGSDAKKYAGAGAAGRGGWNATSPAGPLTLGFWTRYTLPPQPGTRDLWLNRVFLLGGNQLGRVAAPAAAFRGGGGAIRVHVDGDLDIEGLSLIVDAQGSDAGARFAAGAGSIVIVCRGTISCGAGALLQCNPAQPFDTGGGCGGGGGGYVAVIAKQITGVLNINARRAGGINAQGQDGGGSLIEIRTEEPLAATLNTDQTRFSVGNYGNHDSLLVQGYIDTARLPFGEW
jgi:hypothetical protein